VRIKPGSAILDATRYYVPDSDLWEKVYKDGRGEYEQMRKPRPYGLLLNDITPVIDDLNKDFKLGILANQHPPILKALEDYGISRYFDIILIDEIVGVSKPDPRIFHMAIMVGDRPDNDIAPARSLGMKTVRFRRGLLYSLYDPTSESERADIVVRETARIAPAARRLAGA